MLNHNKSSRKIISATTVLSTIIAFIALITTSTSSVHGASETFGYNNIGSSTAGTFGGLYVSSFKSPSNFGALSQVSGYLSTGGTSAQAVLYSDINGKPGTLLAASLAVYQGGTPGSWVSFPVSYTGSPNTVYWMGVLFLGAGTYYFNSGVNGAATYFNSTGTFPAPPRVFPGGNSSSGQELSVYATFNSSTSGQTSGWVTAFLIAVVTAGLIIAVILMTVILRKSRKPAN
jgi:hypothetical protein